jgi:hypothetical protein
VPTGYEPQIALSLALTAADEALYIGVAAGIASAVRNNYEIQATWILRHNQQNQQLTILLLVKIGN